MKNKSQDEVIEQLIKDFEPIEAEVVRMMGNRNIFQEVVEISKRNIKINKGNSFWDLLKESYVALMVSAICRQVDKDDRSSSLINLLDKILYSPVTEKLTKEWFSKQYHRDSDIFLGFHEGIGKNDFEEHFGSMDYIDPNIVLSDLEKLKEDTKKIKRFRNKRIAHRDRNDRLVFDVNFNDLDKAIETVRAITSKYFLLLKQGKNDLIPIDQTDWQKILTIAWIDK